MDKKIKNIIFTILVIIIIAVIAVLGFYILNKNEDIQETENTVNEINQNMQTELNINQSNITVENNTEVNNTVENNTIQNNIIESENNIVKEENTIKNEVQTEVLQDTGASNEDKAINIAKKDWGNSEGVYFTTMGIDASGRYIVTVNDSSTTGTLAWYLVDVVTGKFDIQQ